MRDVFVGGEAHKGFQSQLEHGLRASFIFGELFNMPERFYRDYCCPDVHQLLLLHWVTQEGRYQEAELLKNWGEGCKL